MTTNEPKKAISYTGVVLDRPSHNVIMNLVPEGWDASKTCHHVTLTMGTWKGDPSIIGQEVSIEVVGFVKDDKVAALSVRLPDGLVTKGPPHITVAVTGGGKPFQAGKLDFSSAEKSEGLPTTLRGIVKEVPEGDYSLVESTLRNSILVERWQRLAGIK